MYRIAGVLGFAIASALSVNCRPDSPVGLRAATSNMRLSVRTAFPYHEEPSIAIDNAGRLFVGWKDMELPASANQVAFARSLDGGLTWSVPVQREPMVSGSAQSDPWLRVGPSGVLIYAQQGACTLAVATSPDAGATWTTPVSVHDRAGCADKESMSSDGRANVYLAYHNLEEGLTSIILTVSRDGGTTWSPTTIVARAAGRDYLAPSVCALPDGHVYAAWWALPEGNLEVATSRDFGTTWSVPRRVNPVAGSLPWMRNQSAYYLFPPFPSLAVSTAGVALAWPDHATGVWDVLISRSDDEGASWSAPSRISDGVGGDRWMVALGIDSRDVLHAAWYDSRTGDTDVRYATSPDRGATWSASIRVTTQSTTGASNRLGDYLGLAVARNGTAHLAWTDVRGAEMNIYYASVPVAK
jgi:BNR repeat-like domain